MPTGTAVGPTSAGIRWLARWRVPLMAILGCILLGTSAPVEAQRYFGMNQVGYRYLRWRVIETEHFMVHYYPEERTAAYDAARMAERAYTRLSRLLGHQFREKKPIMLFASRADFGANNVTGDLGEGTGGVTDGLRQRIMLPFTGDYAGLEHVLTHEMVHQFQYDIFSRGKAGANLQVLEQVNPPLWFMEGMAEYLSIGPKHTLTDTWMRSAISNGKFPTLQQMTQDPYTYFPYRYGEALFAYIGERWGDAAIGEIMHSVVRLGIERGFQRELGVTLTQLSDQWREAMRAEFLPQLADLRRVNDIASPLLNPKISQGHMFLGPALSNNGKMIAFLAQGSEKRGEIFVDLWLGDATTGKRIRRLVKSTTNPRFEELRLLYSRGDFSPDDRYFVFTAQTGGRDVLSIVDVTNGHTVQLKDVDVDAALNPTWSPDGTQIAFTGTRGGLSDLYIVNRDGTELRQITNDRYADFHPSWSPDGTRIAMATDRVSTNLDLLDPGKLQIAVVTVSDGTTTVLPEQRGVNINPVWSPDGQSIAYLSDRDGQSNIYLYDLTAKVNMRVTNVQGGVNSVTEYSPALTWSRGTDRMAFTYYDDGDYTVWALDNPRAHARAETPATQVAQMPADTGAQDTVAAPRSGQSTYRSAMGSRQAGRIGADEFRLDSAGISSVAAALADPRTGLPDTMMFKDSPYKVRLAADYISGGSVGVGVGGYGAQYGGQTVLVFSDLTGNHQLGVGAGVAGRLADASFLLAYNNMSRRLQYSTGISQEVAYVYQGGQSVPIQGGGQQDQYQFVRFMMRRISFGTEYPLNRFTRFEAGIGINFIGRSVINLNYDYYPNGQVGYGYEDVAKLSSLNFAAPQVAFVSDNTLFGMTGPISGRRMRFSASPAFGNVRWIDYLADYRRYDPIIFNTLTFSTRLYSNVTVGRDASLFPKYIGQPEFVRGYDRANFYGGYQCDAVLGVPNTGGSACATAQLVGTRVAVFNEELRFPLIRRFDLGSLPIGLPPVDGLIFYDMGLAWNPGQKLSFGRPANYDLDLQRYVMRSWGFGLRVNAFNLLLLKWDYAKPLDRPDNKWNWTFSLGPSF